jgi:hypothetical protein
VVQLVQEVDHAVEEIVSDQIVMTNQDVKFSEEIFFQNKNLFSFSYFTKSRPTITINSTI